MKRLGKVLHLSKSGNLILRLENNNPPPVGREVFDPKLEKIGTVNNVLGPVSTPYLSLTPASDETGEKSVGKIAYLIENR